MGEPKLPPQPPNHPSSLVQPSNKKKQKPIKVFRALRSVLRSFPIINTPACKFSSLPSGVLPEGHRSSGSSNRVTGTLFGYRKGRVSLSIQENPRTLPTMVVELAMQMNMLQKEMSLGLVRIALECDKRPEKEKMKLLEEPMWAMYCNGKKNGYGVKREASEEDLQARQKY
ncbi:hypothetical protein RHGRI_022342 [Rhododendron griersonianum]|uniref:Uncharacterized protein n=1 Tax=Rhododendron griersonianum TaxID=479676 RepID=A0AAV6IZ40_9ERIC|nr:hypothetical protein RHGRI_022342 [Rhododendron griersonianum]